MIAPSLCFDETRFIVMAVLTVVVLLVDLVGLITLESEKSLRMSWWPLVVNDATGIVLGAVIMTFPVMAYWAFFSVSPVICS